MDIISLFVDEYWQGERESERERPDPDGRGDGRRANEGVTVFNSSEGRGRAVAGYPTPLHVEAELSVPSQH
jgi:hypothetical protein